MLASPDELAPTRAAPRAIEDGFPFELSATSPRRKAGVRRSVALSTTSTNGGHSVWARFSGRRSSLLVPRGSPVLDYFRQAVSLDG